MPNPAQQPQILSTDDGKVVVTGNGIALRLSPIGAVPTFPDLIGLGWPVMRAPKADTIVQPAVSGKETTVALQTYTRDQYTLTFNYLKSGHAGSDWATLLSFVKLVKGKALPFHFVDRYDCGRLGQWLGNGTGGANQQFNFVRALGLVTEPVFDVTQVANVRIAGAVVAPATAGVANYALLPDPNWGLQYALQFANGVVVPNGAPVTADFTYAWACRLDEDSAAFSSFMLNFWELKKLSFTTMKVV